MTQVFDQAESDIRCEWGERGVAHLAPISDAIIIVDVMSFSSCVSIAVSRGAVIFPWRWKDESSYEFAKTIGAQVAGRRGQSTYSLSPRSLLEVPSGLRLVLPSPNGSTLTLSTAGTPTYAGCLRNARAVAAAAMTHGSRIAVIPAGERWKEDDSLRPAIEDLIGAGALIQHLKRNRSPEADCAVAAFESANRRGLGAILRECSSGKELIEMGFETDIDLIAQLDADSCAPLPLESP